MLNRWIAYKRELSSGSKKPPMFSGKRPSNANECSTIVECEKWRMQILRDIGKKVVEIQNGNNCNVYSI